MTYANIPEFKAALDAQIGMESVITESTWSSCLTFSSPTGWPLFFVEAYQDGDRVMLGAAGGPNLYDRVKAIMLAT